MTGTIFDMQRFCTQDGPGIRTTVFLKGCPLSCPWCHNPESQREKPELLYDASLCVLCGKCVSACPNGCHSIGEGIHAFRREQCTACGACVTNGCSALSLSGKAVSAEDVLKEALKDKAFYKNSGGGITLSGGEPLLQSRFSLALLQGAQKAGLHTCLETCGFTSSQVMAASAPFVDLYLFDYKLSDPEAHKRFTGTDNRQILENLTLLDSLGKDIILRCPIIPTVNDREEHFAAIADLANRLKHIREIQIEPYHDLGVSKYAKLSREYTLSHVQPVPLETAQEYVSKIQAMTDKPVSIPK